MPIYLLLIALLSLVIPTIVSFLLYKLHKYHEENIHLRDIYDRLLSENNNLKKESAEINIARYQIKELTLREQEYKTEKQNYADRILDLEKEKVFLNNQLQTYKLYEEKNINLTLKVEELQNALQKSKEESRLAFIDIVNKKEEELSKLRIEKTKFENLYTAEKASHDNIKDSINTYVLHIMQNNEKLINENFDKKNKQSEQNITNITSVLIDDIKKIVEKVANIETKNNNTEKLVDNLKNSLLIPHKAGHTSEITLENILISSGLKKKLSENDIGDFIMQNSIKLDNLNALLRPDAIIYLPNNNYLIIDSKTSSHFIELQNAIEQQNIIAEKNIKQKIKDRINKHLNDLIQKDYTKALTDYLKYNNTYETEPNIMTVLFVQTEKILELIREIDPKLESRAFHAQIPITGPLGLINLLNTSKYSIQKYKQEKNMKKIKDEIMSMMDNLYTIFERTNKMGKKLADSMSFYNSLATTFNSSLLNRIRNISKLGAEGKKELPNRLDKYTFDNDIIEGELKITQQHSEKLIEE